MQDSDRQKHPASEQPEGDSKAASGQQPEHLPRHPQDADSHSQGRPASRTQRSTERQTPNSFVSDSLQERGRVLKQEAQALANTVRESADLFNRYVTEQAEQRPYTTVGIAAGLGFVLGGGLANRITAVTLGTAYRLGLALAAQELSSRISSPGAHEESSRKEWSAR